MKASDINFRAMVVPIITFACELWVLTDFNVKILEDFQRYAGRRLQRFHQGSPRETSFVALGWIRLEIYVYVNKLLFLRSISYAAEGSIYKTVFVHKRNEYEGNPNRGLANLQNSPTYDILNAAKIFGLYDVVCDMLRRVRVYKKK